VNLVYNGKMFWIYFDISYKTINNGNLSIKSTLLTFSWRDLQACSAPYLAALETLSSSCIFEIMVSCRVSSLRNSYFCRKCTVHVLRWIWYFHQYFNEKVDWVFPKDFKWAPQKPTLFATVPSYYY